MASCAAARVRPIRRARPTDQTDCDAIRPVLPVATQSTVGIYASGQALESLIMHLLGDDLPEAQETGQKILEENRKIIPMFLEHILAFVSMAALKVLQVLPV